jgi:hypothetical protein
MQPRDAALIVLDLADRTDDEIEALADQLVDALVVRRNALVAPDETPRPRLFRGLRRLANPRHGLDQLARERAAFGVGHVADLLGRPPEHARSVRRASSRVLGPRR